MNGIFRNCWFIIIGIALTGCATVPPPPHDLATDVVNAPDQFVEASFGPHVSAADSGSAWLTNFNDPVLTSLVDDAWRNNPDLYTTAARFEEAVARLRIAASFLSPQVDGFGGARYTNTNGDSDEDEYAIGVRVSWEIDLWGRLRSDRTAAANIAAASGLDLVQAHHSLAAAVAEAYFAVITAKQQLAIDRQLLQAEQFTAETTRQRVDAGLGTTLDANLAESSVQLADAAVQGDLSALREAQRALELLLGRYPSAELDAAADTLPAVPPDTISVGIPSSLLERRPDVRSAERLVDAAYYDLRSAQSAKLPRLTLSADAATLIDPSDFVTSVAADILAPLLQGGRLRAEEAAANARQRQAIGQFATVALRAFREVESALSNARHLDAREVSIRQASEQLQRANEAAINRYDQGLLSILDLQQVRRQDFETRSLLLGIRFDQLRERLNLYLALGGSVVNDTEQQDASALDPAPAGELRVGVPLPPDGENPMKSENDDGR